METEGILHIEWVGDANNIRGYKNPVITININGRIVAGRVPYSDPLVIDVPLIGDMLTVKVVLGKDGKTRENTMLKHTYRIEAGRNYELVIHGSAAGVSGLKMRLSKPDREVDESDPDCRSNTLIGFLSFLFPIYGIYNYFTSTYNKMASVAGAICGFFLPFIISGYAYSNYINLGFGFGSTSLFDYEPFSAIDFIINFLIGGLSFIQALISLLLSPFS